MCCHHYSWYNYNFVSLMKKNFVDVHKCRKLLWLLWLKLKLRLAQAEGSSPYIQLYSVCCSCSCTYSFFLGSLIFLSFAARLKQDNSSSSGLLSTFCIISSSFSSIASFSGPCHILFPSVGLLTGVEGDGVVSLDEVPADDWLSSVSPPISMSGVAASCS